MLPFLCVSDCQCLGRDMTGYLLRAAEITCVGSGWLFSVLQLSGLFGREQFPFWFGKV